MNCSKEEGARSKRRQKSSLAAAAAAAAAFFCTFPRKMDGRIEEGEGGAGENEDGRRNC